MVRSFVIDTNVWCLIDRDISTIQSIEELDCYQANREWLREFIHSDDKLGVDISYQILSEYRKNITRGGLAQQWLNRLETQPRDKRLIEVFIEFDNHGYAILPELLLIPDESDRKFVAVALKIEPHPPIVNAVDSDWTSQVARLLAQGIEIIELCEAWQSRRQR